MFYVDGSLQSHEVVMPEVVKKTERSPAYRPFRSSKQTMDLKYGLVVCPVCGCSYRVSDLVPYHIGDTGFMCLGSGLITMS